MNPQGVWQGWIREVGRILPEVGVWQQRGLALFSLGAAAAKQCVAARVAAVVPGCGDGAEHNAAVRAAAGERAAGRAGGDLKLDRVEKAPMNNPVHEPLLRHDGRVEGLCTFHQFERRTDDGSLLSPAVDVPASTRFRDVASAVIKLRRRHSCCTTSSTHDRYPAPQSVDQSGELCASAGARRGESLSRAYMLSERSVWAQLVFSQARNTPRVEASSTSVTFEE